MKLQLTSFYSKIYNKFAVESDSDNGISDDMGLSDSGDDLEEYIDEDGNVRKRKKVYYF